MVGYLTIDSLCCTIPRFWEALIPDDKPKRACLINDAVNHVLV